MVYMTSTHKELDVWRVAMDLVVTVHMLTGRMPSNERFGLGARMRIAAVSVPSNAAEGLGVTALRNS